MASSMRIDLVPVMKHWMKKARKEMKWAEVVLRLDIIGCELTYVGYADKYSEDLKSLVAWCPDCGWSTASKDYDDYVRPECPVCGGALK